MPEKRQRFSNTTELSKDQASRRESNPRDGNGPNTTGTDAHTGTGTGTGTRRPLHSDKPPRYGSSFEARFGRVILQHGIAAIPSAIFHYQGEIGLKAQHVWFVSYILSHKWDEDLPYPSLSNMARCTGVTLRNIQFIKSDLCRAGMLQISERYNGKGGRDSNAYDFSGLFAHIEDLISEEVDEPNRIGAALPVIETPVIDIQPIQIAPNTSDLDPSFVARFGRVIARRGVAAVPRAVFTHQKALCLTPQQVWFVSYIFSFQWSTTFPYPSINKMVQHTGYSRAHLHTIKAELVDAGYLRLVHRTNDQGGQDSNAYDFSGLLDAIRSQLLPDQQLLEIPDKDPEAESLRGRHLFSPRRGQGGARQRSSTRMPAGDERSEPSEQTGAYESQFTTPYEEEQTGVYESQQTEGYETEQTPLYEEGQTGRVNPDSYRATNVRRRGTMKQRGHESESNQEETNDKNDDSNQHHPKKQFTTKETVASALNYSQYIAAVASDFSHELGDSIHEASNISQAVNLWNESALSESSFIKLIYEAKQLTRQYQGKNGLRGIEKKMAYFFTVLRDLCGLRNEADTIDKHISTGTGDSGSDPDSLYASPPSERSRTRSTDAPPALLATQDTSPMGEDRSMISTRQLWQAALSELQAIVPASDFQTWLKNTSILTFENGTVVIGVPANFAKEWLEKRYSKQIAETLYNMIGYSVKVRFEVRPAGAIR